MEGNLWHLWAQVTLAGIQSHDHTKLQGSLGIVGQIRAKEAREMGMVNSWSVSAPEPQSEGSKGAADVESSCLLQKGRSQGALLPSVLPSSIKAESTGLSHVVGQSLLASLIKTHVPVSLRKPMALQKPVGGDLTSAWLGLGTQFCLCQSMNTQLWF